MANGKIDGTNKVVIQSLLLALSEAQEDVLRVRQALGETIVKIGKELLGEQGGDGQFILRQDDDGSFIVDWELKSQAPASELIPNGDNPINKRKRRSK